MVPGFVLGPMTTFISAGRAIAAALFGLMLVVTSAVADDARPTGPDATKFVADLGQSAIVVISESGLTAEKRLASFGTLLDQGFDLDAIGKFVVGRFWSEATPGQQDTYRPLFRAFVLKKYSALFGDYSGQRFVVSRAVDAGERDVVVSSEIVTDNGAPVSTDWRVRKLDGSLKVIDIKVEGVSMLASQREEFSSVIRQRGFDGLLELLRNQTGSSS